MKKLLLFFALCFALSAQANIHNDTFDKIYVSPDKISITATGIFYINEVGDFFPIEMVGCDQCGIFIVADSTTCEICGREYGKHAIWCPLGSIPNTQK